MAQHDMVIDNASGASVRSDINNALAAIASLNSGASAPSTPYADQVWVDTANGLIKQRNSANSASITIGRRGEAYWGLAPHGGCQLSKSGANLLLSPFKGNKLLINGALEVVPASTTLAATSLSANTTYYIYAYMNAGTLTLEASATAPATGSDGVTIKTADATRTLVGMARTIAGPAWADTAAQRFVRSWFNDRGLGSFKYTTGGDVNFGSAPWAEVSTTNRIEALLWTGEAFRVTARASCYDNNGTSTFYLSAAVDGGTQGFPSYVSTTAAGQIVSLSAEYADNGLAQGYHYFQLFGGVANFNTPYYNDEYTGLVLSTMGSGA